MGAYLGSNSIHLDRSCYIYSDPLKWGTWVLTQEWALAQDTAVHVLEGKYLLNEAIIQSKAKSVQYSPYCEQVCHIFPKCAVFAL